MVTTHMRIVNNDVSPLGAYIAMPVDYLSKWWCDLCPLMNLRAKDLFDKHITVYQTLSISYLHIQTNIIV